MTCTLREPHARPGAAPVPLGAASVSSAAPAAALGELDPRSAWSPNPALGASELVRLALPTEARP